MLTGASGFLGCYVLKELYDKTDKKIYCLIRDEEKFKSVLSHHTNITLSDSRIICIIGDITKEQLDISNDLYNSLVKDVSDVIHCAATISLFGSWEDSKRVNYMGTCNVLDFVEKASAKIHHISTISVSGDSVVEQKNPSATFNENDLFIGQSYADNIYVHSKYLAEQEVLLRFQRSNIDASIYRIGHILWDSKTGKFQDNYYSSDVYMLINAFKTIGKLPEILVSQKMPIIPVNECAKIICEEINAEQNRVYHLYDDSITRGEFMASLGVTEKISFEEFMVEAQKYQSQTMRFTEMFLTAMVMSNGQFDVNITNEETRKYLEKHDCLWQGVDSEYVKMVILNDQ